MGIEAESAIDQFKYITDRGLGLGAKIITAHIGKVPDDEKVPTMIKCYRFVMR